MGLFSALPDTDGHLAELFRSVREEFAAEQGRRALLADHLTIAWIATAVADRTDLSFDDAARLLVGVAVDGGPDLRTSKGMACASIILGVLGAPIQPALH